MNATPHEQQNDDTVIELQQAIHAAGLSFRHLVEGLQTALDGEQVVPIDLGLEPDERARYDYYTGEVVYELPLLAAAMCGLLDNPDAGPIDRESVRTLVGHALRAGLHQGLAAGFAELCYVRETARTAILPMVRRSIREKPVVQRAMWLYARQREAGEQGRIPIEDDELRAMLRTFRARKPDTLWVRATDEVAAYCVRTGRCKSLSGRTVRRRVPDMRAEFPSRNGVRPKPGQR